MSLFLHSFVIAASSSPSLRSIAKSISLDSRSSSSCSRSESRAFISQALHRFVYWYVVVWILFLFGCCKCQVKSFTVLEYNNPVCWFCLLGLLHFERFVFPACCFHSGFCKKKKKIVLGCCTNKFWFGFGFCFG